jgi:glycosyltransferase involved in cell wall biosynthesis
MLALSERAEPARVEGPVLHVIPHLWSGAGAVVTRLCEAQRQHGLVTIVTAGSLGAEGDWAAYRARLRRAGVEHRTIDFFNRDEATFWSSANALANLIREIAPGVIHAHAGVPASGAAIARALSGNRARLIGQMYSWGPNRPEWMNQQDMWGFARTDRVVCSADAYLDLLIRYGVPTRKLTYLPWGLQLDELPWRECRRMPAPVIGFVGRIEPRKGQIELVKAFARVRRIHPKARLELVGPIADERYAAALRTCISRAKLGSAVTIKGAVPNAIACLRRWDLFVSLSSDEGQGLAVLEAMATGVPVLARPVAGISDFLRDGETGVALPHESAKDVADAILQSLDNRQRLQAIACRARRMVERHYSWDRTVAQFDSLYWR